MLDRRFGRQLLGKADLSLDNSAYWDEIAHANSNSDFDADYWQVIKPNMTRFDESGNGASYSTRFLPMG